jgi:hypothetical protein
MSRRLWEEKMVHLPVRGPDPYDTFPFAFGSLFAPFRDSCPNTIIDIHLALLGSAPPSPPQLVQPPLPTRTSFEQGLSNKLHNSLVINNNSQTSVVQRWRTDTCLPFSCELYDVVTGKEPRLCNCPPSSCHRVLYPRYYGLIGTFSCKTAPARGTRGVVLLSSRVWKGCHCLGTRDWYLMHHSNPFITGGQKHTHTHTHTHNSQTKECINQTRNTLPSSTPATLVAAMNKKAAQPLAPSHSCMPSLQMPNSGPSTAVSGSKEKKRILEEYVSKFGSGYQESIITKKKGKLDHNESLQSLASSWQCMKPSTNKYYQVKELTLYNVIRIVIREYAAFSKNELLNIRLLNTDFATMISKLQRWLQIDFSLLHEP